MPRFVLAGFSKIVGRRSFVASSGSAKVEAPNRIPKYSALGGYLIASPTAIYMAFKDSSLKNPQPSDIAVYTW
ncbi:MAG: hypothetical protein Hyperionvirus36_17 [Hyperionvirus sp.]|uniref:Uncharacterized protein n=1 Tax=Hyperionvirus sp. TaxID=2487770 RepID=A0A3G5AC05_9VIRU|nr:MAG: hypothetical protein Hyperionvirus36_17 [Hyperionvirus sp.]